MINSYLIEVVKAMSPELRTEMSLFLESSLYNRGINGPVLQRAFEIICKTAPHFSEADLSKEVVYDQIFPSQAIVPGKLEKILVELNKLLRQFLLIKQYLSESNEQRMNLDWVSWLRDAGMIDRAQQILQKGGDQSEGEESLENYWIKFRLAEENHEIQSMQNRVSGDLHIPALLKSLDLYYQNYKVELKNRYRLQQMGIPLPNLTDEENPQSFYIEESNLYRISSQVEVLLLKEEIAPEDVLALLSLLNENEANLSSYALTQFFVFLRSLCTILIDNGQLGFVEVLHKIQKDNLNRGLFLINGSISPNSYINVVQIAIRAKQIEWAKMITQDFRKRLLGGDKDHFFYRFNMAHCLFAEGRLEDALKELPDSPSNSHYHGIVRRLELKIYFEMGSELLHYKLFAFRKYYERTASKNFPAKLRAMHIEFFNILLQLTQSPPKDKARSQRLIERIQKKKLLADRAWLLEKARELG